MDKQTLHDSLKLDYLIQEIKGLDSLPSSDVSDANDDDNEIDISNEIGNPFYPVGLGTSSDHILKTTRQWMKNVICEESSDSETDYEEYFEHELKLKNSSQFYKKTLQADPYLSKYMYFGSDVLTGDEKWFTNFESVVGKHRLKGDKPENGQKSKDTMDDTDLDGHCIFISPKFRNHWSLCGQNMNFNMQLVRDRIWKCISKKEIPKAYKKRSRNHVAKLASMKRFCKETAQFVRTRDKLRTTNNTSLSRRQIRDTNQNLKQCFGTTDKYKKRQ